MRGVKLRLKVCIWFELGDSFSYGRSQNGVQNLSRNFADDSAAIIARETTDCFVMSETALIVVLWVWVYSMTLLLSKI